MSTIVNLRLILLNVNGWAYYNQKWHKIPLINEDKPARWSLNPPHLSNNEETPQICPYVLVKGTAYIIISLLFEGTSLATPTLQDTTLHVRWSHPMSSNQQQPLPSSTTHHQERHATTVNEKNGQPNSTQLQRKTTSRDYNCATSSIQHLHTATRKSQLVVKGDIVCPRKNTQPPSNSAYKDDAPLAKRKHTAARKIDQQGFITCCSPPAKENVGLMVPR